MGSAAEPSSDLVTVAAALKARFKKICIQTNNVHQNWQIRVHRAISWLRRAGELPQMTEARLLFTWIALNSLYSRWDMATNAPGRDTEARNKFISITCEWDGQQIARLLQQHRGLIKALFDNPYLSGVFWRDPENPRAKGWAAEDAKTLDRNLKDGDARRVLQQTMDRLFVFRGQLVHGASTGGSTLNRKTLKHCLAALELLVPPITSIVIEHGCHDEWPELCYPPLRG